MKKIMNRTFPVLEKFTKDYTKFTPTHPLYQEVKEILDYVKKLEEINNKIKKNKNFENSVRNNFYW